MSIRFRKNQRVIVTDPESPFVGKCGTVVRLLRRSPYEAWVNFDEPLPIDLRSFPKSDPRANHALVLDDECEEITEHSPAQGGAL